MADLAQTFSYDPTTDIGRVRFALADTNPTEAWFSNEELQALLDQAGSVQGATADAILQLRMHASRHTRAFSGGGVSYNDTGQAKNLDELWKVYAPFATVTAKRSLRTSLGAAQPYDRTFGS